MCRCGDTEGGLRGRGWRGGHRQTVIERGNTKEMLVYEAVATTLKDLGVESVFGLMGDGNLRFITYMAQHCGIKHYSAKHETGAFSMAEAYARITGKVG